MKLKMIDKLRIISDICLNRKTLIKRIDYIERIIHGIQRELDIPEDLEVAVAILSVLFNVSKINGKVPFNKFMLKIGIDKPTIIQEDIIYLVNNQYIEIGKYANDVESIRITAKLYNQIWQDMTEKNHKLFMLLAGRELNEPQLKFLRSQLFNNGLDISQLFLSAVSFRQYEAARVIISFGFDMNKEYEVMAYELFVCSQVSCSKYCIDFYIQHDLKITDRLLDEIVKFAQENSEDFEVENTFKLIAELRRLKE